MSGDVTSYFLLLAMTAMKCYCFMTCESTDREYSCDCLKESRNRTVFSDSNWLYNASTANFIPAIKTLQYCSGSISCKPNYKLQQPTEIINADNYLICFSDDSCFSNGSKRHAIVTGEYDGTCLPVGCTDLKYFLDFVITNDILETSTYKCIKIATKEPLYHYCLDPVCNNFRALEKLCVCNFQSQNCTCSNYCQNLNTVLSNKTYALFLVFGDIYVTTGSKIVALSYAIAGVLTLGLVILLMIILNLCKAALINSLQNENENNTEVLRRILTATLEPSPPPLPAPVKESETAIEVVQNSPPPTYEQVLKDKFIEFKKSVV